MIIEKNINHNGKIFKILTDDTRVWDSADKVIRRDFTCAKQTKCSVYPK